MHLEVILWIYKAAVLHEGILCFKEIAATYGKTSVLRAALQGTEQ